MRIILSENLYNFENLNTSIYEEDIAKEYSVRGSYI